MPAVKDAIIIGAGIGGLATAVALSRVGIRTRVFERAHELRELGAGLTIWSNAIASLAQIGLDQETVKAGACVDHFDVLTAPGRLLGRVSLPLPGVEYPTVSIHRRAMLDVLAQAAQSYSECSVMTASECVSVKQKNGRVTVAFSDGREETTELLIGADGIHSAVRGSVVDAEHDPLLYAGYTCFRGMAEIQPVDWSLHGLTETVGKGSQFGMLNIGAGRISWYATMNTAPRERSHRTGYYLKQELLKRFGTWHDPIRSLLEATRSEDYLTNDIYDREPIKTFVKGNICLLGDAAHPTTPNLGQGACQAIEDAVELASCLATYNSVPGAMVEYDHRRVKRTTRVVLQSRMAGQLCQLESPVGCMVRNYLMKFSFSGRVPAGWDWLVTKYHPTPLSRS